MVSKAASQPLPPMTKARVNGVLGRKASAIHLELQSTSHILLQGFRDGLIKVAQNLHSQLWMDAGLADEVIESIRQRKADAALVSHHQVAPNRRQEFSVPAPPIQLIERL